MIGVLGVNIAAGVVLLPTMACRQMIQFTSLAHGHAHTMHEVAGNEAERKKRAAELKKKALKRQREGLKPCDTNFIEKNQMESREVH